MRAPVELIYLLIFAAVLILAQAVAGTLWGRADRLGRANRRMRLLQSGMSEQQVASLLLRPSDAADTAKSAWSAINQRLNNLIAQAGLAVTPVQLLLYTSAGAAALWALSLTAVVLARGNIALNASAAFLGAALVAILLMLGWLQYRKDKRVRRIDEQLPLALDVMVRALKAGHPVIATVQLAAREMKDPIGTEFGLIVDEVNFGADFKAALEHFAARTGSDDARYLAVAISVQLETGGNLAEILESIARTMRSRATLRKRVRSLSSEGRMSAYILSVLPAALVGFQLVVNPRFYTDKFSDPIFWPAVSVVGVFYVLGWLIMHRIMNFKY
jgi:tight adherence protein B